jgi:hypothetical protein
MGALFGGAPALAAAPTPTPAPSDGAAAPAPKKGTPVCTITDKNAVGLSGMVVSGGNLYAVNDSTPNPAQKKVFKFNPATCATVGTPIGYPGPPRDPEDMAVDANGTIWIGDIGDNNAERTNVALWKLAADKITGPFRVSYPDGKKYDAEAFLMGADGLPIIITKLPKPLVFVPTAPLVENSVNGVPMKQVGEVIIPKTTTEVSIPLGRTVITGAAISPDRSKVVLRTYADAFEYTVTNNDIVKAITSGKPKITALPGEPLGESICYSADGKNFLTVSDSTDETAPVKREVLSYVPNAEDINAAPSNAAGPPKKTDDGKSFWSSLISSTDRLYMLIGGVGVLGLLLVLLGILGISRARKRRRAEEKRLAAEAENYHDDGYGYQDPQYGYQEPRGNVYGHPQGNVYGTPQGNVHGGGNQHHGYDQGYDDQGYYGEQPPYGQQQQPNYGHPDQGHPDQGYPNQGYPNQGYPDQGYR